MSEIVVLFDGPCTLCNKSVDSIITEISMAIFPLRLWSKWAAEHLPEHLKSEDSVVLFMHGQFHIRSKAALLILEQLPGYRRTKVFHLVPTFTRPRVPNHSQDALQVLWQRLLYTSLGTKNARLIRQNFSHKKTPSAARSGVLAAPYGAFFAPLGLIDSRQVPRSSYELQQQKLQTFSSALRSNSTTFSQPFLPTITEHRYRYRLVHTLRLAIQNTGTFSSDRERCSQPTLLQKAPGAYHAEVPIKPVNVLPPTIVSATTYSCCSVSKIESIACCCTALINGIIVVSP